MTTHSPLPPHLEEIGRQLTAAAQELNDSARYRRRSTAHLSAAGGLALTVAAAAVVILSAGGLRHGVGSTQTVASVPVTARHTTTRRQTLPRLVHPTAAQVLHRAAYVALQTTPTVPAADQFVYTKTQNASGQIGQSWLSVDGTRSSLVEQPGSTTPQKLAGCVNGHSSQRTLGRDGKPLSDFIPKRYRGTAITTGGVIKRFFGGRVPMDGPVVTTRCTPQPAFFAEMPTTVSAMLPYLVKTDIVYPAGLVPAANDLNDLAKDVGYMLDTSYLLPRQQAALYDLLAKTPGIRVKTGVTDVAGRAGVGVEWSFEGGTSMLIFDPATFQYLGESTLGLNGASGGDALLQTAIVDSPGQLPQPSPAPTTNGA